MASFQSCFCPLEATLHNRPHLFVSRPQFMSSHLKMTVTVTNKASCDSPASTYDVMKFSSVSSVHHPVLALQQCSQIILTSRGHTLQLSRAASERCWPLKCVVAVLLPHVLWFANVDRVVTLEVDQNRAVPHHVVAGISPSVPETQTPIQVLDSLSGKLSTRVWMRVGSVLTDGNRPYV